MTSSVDEDGTAHQSTPAPAVQQAPSTATKWLRWALLASLVGPTVLLAYVAATSYQAAVRDSRLRLARVAQIAQEQSARVVETNEVVSRAVVGVVGGRSSATLRQHRAELHGTLRGLAGDLQQFQSIWIWDESGHPVASSIRPDPPASLSVQDREYFQWATTTDSRDWYVSEPLRSKLTGEPFFDFTKRLSRPDGRFAGVLSISLFPSYFGKLFRELVQQDEAFSVVLLRSDGVIISRHPDVEMSARLGPASPTLRDMRAGLLSGEHAGVSTIDNRFRFVAFRKVGALPLYVAATADRDLVLAPWRRATWLLASFTIPLSLLLAGLCWYAIRRVRGEHAMARIHAQEYEHRLRAERALRQSQKMEALGRLTAGVAHDFNNLLMVVQNSAVLAQKLEQRGKPTTPALAPIQRAVATGAQLTRQLLAFARRQPLQVSNVSLQGLIPAVADLLKSSLGRNYEIEVSLEPDLPAVRADEAELELALINLCINARDAMPDGGRMSIAASPCTEGAPGHQERVRICVRDHGHGIPPELVDKVLQPFFTTKPVGKGTGLGLSQVQSCVEQAGGELRLDTEPGKGTTVILTLPAGTRSASRPERAPMAELKLQGDLLLVEDNDEIARSLSVLLADAGLRVQRYDHAEAAWEHLQQGRPCDILLSDISLAGPMTGVDLALRVAQQRRDLPILLMTGYTDRLSQATEAGFTVLPKPIGPDALMASISQALVKSTTGTLAPV
jgi:signal transduction histidine kinase/CheY-like chemotaxis protein